MLFWSGTVLVLGLIGGPVIGERPSAGDDRRRVDPPNDKGLSDEEAKAIADKNAGWIGNLYALESRLMAPYAPTVAGKEAVRREWEKMLSAPGFALTFTPREITVARGGDIAYDIGTWQQPGNPGDQGKYLVLWKRIEGDWKVVADIFNSDRPCP